MMPPRLSSVLVIISALVPAAALAQEAPEKGPPPIPRFSSELIDSDGASRLQLITRMTFSDGDRVFGGVSVQSYEGRLHVGLIDGLALGVVVPAGVLTPPNGVSSESFVGNISFGASGGFAVVNDPSSVIFRLGGGLEIFLPTSPGPKSETAALAQVMVASIRAYEPQAYLPQLFSVRFRTQGQVSIDNLDLALELSLSPGTTVGDTSEFVMMFGVATSASYLIGRSVEPFLEVSAALDVSAPSPIRPPLLVTPGVRFHIGDLFDPSVFFSLNFVHAPQLMFGIDLAGVLRPSDDSKKSFRDDPLDSGF